MAVACNKKFVIQRLTHNYARDMYPDRVDITRPKSNLSTVAHMWPL